MHTSHSAAITRRLFLAHAAAVGATGILTPSVLANNNGGSRLNAGSKHWIDGIRLRTSQPIEAMAAFYGQKLRFPIREKSESTVGFQTGASTLTFERDESADAIYHFAFNIPENMIRQAHAWQSKRTSFILPPKRLNDEGLPREVVAFRNWNAHSVFFWDPAGNAVEYIARHDLNNAQTGPFSERSILYISEIGLVVDDVPSKANAVKQATGTKTYISSSDQFEPVGDQHGLILMMKRGRRMAFEQGGKRDIFPTDVTLNGLREPFGLDGLPYRLVPTPEPSK